MNRHALVLVFGLGAAGCLAPPPVTSTSSDERYDTRYRRQESELISSGVDHACVVRSDNRIWCWGDDSFGQLGDGGAGGSHVPTLSTLVVTPMAAVSVGAWHSCGLTLDGHVQCWGDNSYGQLGNGSVVSSKPPVTVSGVDHAVQVASGDFTSCALIADGTVKCWGRNGSYQVGDGTNLDRSTPVTVTINDSLGTPLVHDVVDLTAAFDHTCSRDVTGKIFCWGNPGSGADYLGTKGALYPAYVGQVTTGASAAAGMSAGSFSTCEVRVDGTIWCAGLNTWGDLGDGSTTDSRTPVQVFTTTGPLTGGVAVSGGWGHTCALVQGGLVYCWGDDRNGAVGDGTTGGFKLFATQVINLANVVAISAGEDFSCALRGGGDITCWGVNSNWQLGNTGPWTNHPVAVNLGSDSGALDLAVGNTHGCLRNADGSAECWGNNVDGQLGDGTVTAHYTPAPVISLANTVAVAAGYQHSCALLSDGTAKCWGLDSWGELGDGYSSGLRTSPWPVGGLSGAIAIGASGEHTCALRNDGTLLCWGQNSHGQLGDGTYTTRTAPTAAGIGRVMQFSTGLTHTCAIHPAGLQCWGENTDGEIGDGTVIMRPSPVVVAGLSGLPAQVSAGDRHTCALMTNGQLQCWGNNSYGQLGDGSTTSEVHPVLASPTEVSAVSAGGTHTCALYGDGSVWCWGNNSYGQLGLPAGGISTVPVRLVAPGSALAVVTGMYSSCVLENAGTVHCFGVVTL